MLIFKRLLKTFNDSAEIMLMFSHVERLNSRATNKYSSTTVPRHERLDRRTRNFTTGRKSLSVTNFRSWRQESDKDPKFGPPHYDPVRWYGIPDQFCSGSGIHADPNVGARACVVGSTNLVNPRLFLGCAILNHCDFSSEKFPLWGRWSWGIC